MREKELEHLLRRWGEILPTRMKDDECPDETAIRAYHDNLFDEKECAGIERHLGGCPHCLSRLAGVFEGDRKSRKVRVLPGAKILSSTIKDLAAALEREILLEGRELFSTVFRKLRDLADDITPKTLAYDPATLRTRGRGARIEPIVHDILNDVIALYETGSYEECIALLERAGGPYFENDTIQYYLGLCHLKIDDVPGAIRHLKSAVSLEPTVVHYRWCLGHAFLKRGDARGAREIFRGISAMGKTLSGKAEKKLRDIEDVSRQSLEEPPTPTPEQ